MLRGHEGLGAILLCTDMIIAGNKYARSLPTNIPINEAIPNTPVSFPYAFWECWPAKEGQWIKGKEVNFE